MYSSDVERLARFLIGGNPQSADLCRFLVLDTFAKFKASAIVVLGISGDGHLRPESSFGLPDAVLNSLGFVPLSAEIPIVAGFRSNQFAWISREESKAIFPQLHEFDDENRMPENIAGLVLCPILPYGGFALALNSYPDLDQEIEMYFRAVGTLTALHFNRLQLEGSQNSTRKQSLGNNGKTELTERQKLIKKMMENGYTNSAIANEIGYSESLVRQETMAIFAILKIDGRKELLKNSSQ